MFTYNGGSEGEHRQRDLTHTHQLRVRCAGLQSGLAGQDRRLTIKSDAQNLELVSEGTERRLSTHPYDAHSTHEPSKTVSRRFEIAVVKEASLVEKLLNLGKLCAMGFIFELL